MRILYVITQSVLGGAQSHVRDLLGRASQTGETGLIAGDNGPLMEAARALGVKTWVVPSLTRAINPWRDLRALKEIRSIIRQFQPDLVHAHSSKAGILGRLAAKKEGVPALFTAHGWAFTDQAPALRRGLAIWLERRVAPLSARIICVSEYDRTLALRYNIAPADKLQVIPNALPDLPFQTAYPERASAKCIMVARFAPPKRHDALLRAVAGLDLPWELLLVGEGKRLEATRRLAEQLSISHRVYFLGALKEVPEILADSDIFVLNSDYEGFPYVTLEAMRAGLPVIASDVGGVKEAVQDGITGFLIPRGDKKGLQEKLARLIENREMRAQMGEAGRRRFLEKFPVEKMLEATFRVYRDVQSEAPAGKKGIKVLLVITQAVLGGAQSQTRELLRRALAQGEAGVVAGDNGPLLEAARELGAKTWVVPNLTRYLIPWKDLRVIFDIERILREFNPDIVHANSSKAGFAARLASRRVGVPVIFTARGWAFAENTPLWRRPLALVAERALAPLAARIVCVSHYDRGLAIRRKVGKPEQLMVIHNGATDIPLQTTYPERPCVKGVMVARFSRQKDQALLLRALAELKLPMEMLLVGEGELLEQHRKLAQRLGLAERVQFLGGRKDVPEILADCDIFVLTSHYEGFPNVTLEAMRAGLPVIASDVGGTKEAIIEGVTGFIIPHQDLAALKEKLTYLLQNREVRIKMGQAGRQHYLENFTAEKMTQAYWGVYQEAINRRSQR